MMEKTAKKEEKVFLTQTAAEKLKEIMRSQDKTGYALRLGLVSQGCSSFVYNMDFEKIPAEDDMVFEQHELKIFVDKKSMRMLGGTTVDYVEAGSEAGFKMVNPNIKPGC